MKKQTSLKELKILSVGNSFSVDTMEHLANVALAAGVERIKLGNLYVGGCSIKRHYTHAMENTPIYRYYTNDGFGWHTTPKVAISEATDSTDWDWVSIQHGTGDKSRYTSPESYEHLPALIAYIKELAPQARIAFNMTWIGEPTRQHHEIVSYGGDQMLMYRKVTELTRDLILPMREIDAVSPTGTAIQNARTATKKLLTRDGYHLSLDLGRYIASLTFFSALTGVQIHDLSWMPEGVSEEEKRIAIAAANAALRTPFSVTELSE